MSTSPMLRCFIDAQQRQERLSQWYTGRYAYVCKQIRTHHTLAENKEFLFSDYQEVVRSMRTTVASSATVKQVVHQRTQELERRYHAMCRDYGYDPFDPANAHFYE